MRQSVGSGALGFGPDHYEQISGTGLDGLVGQEVTRREELPVVRRGHHGAGVEDARQLREGGLQLHQHDRVVVAARPHVRLQNAHVSASRG